MRLTHKVKLDPNWIEIEMKDSNKTKKKHRDTIKTKLYYSKNGEKHCTYTMARMVVAISKKRGVYYAHLQKNYNNRLKLQTLQLPLNYKP